MRIPSSRGHKAIRQVVRLNSSTYTFERPGSNKGRFADGAQSTTSVTEDAWLFNPTEVNIDTEFGDRLTGALGGLAMPGADIQVKDRVTFQGIEYEVAESVVYKEGTEAHPGDTSDGVVRVLTLEKRVNA